MNVRWRLTILGLQLAVLFGGTAFVLGNLPVSETWFIAGALAVIVNPQLLEPFYSRPGDVVANSLVGLVVWLGANRSATPTGWAVLGVALVVSAVVGAVALAAGAGRREGRFVGVGRAARQLSQLASARVIYSAIFWVALLGFRSPDGRDFWLLGLIWLVLVTLGRANWQAIWQALADGAAAATVERLIGPSRLLLTAADLPTPGNSLELVGRAVTAQGVVVTRIRRRHDAWAEVLVPDQATAERFLIETTITTRPGRPDAEVVGAVDAGSTVTTLSFVPTRSLALGDVVAVEVDGRQVLYQIVAGAIEEKRVRDGAHLVPRATAQHLGIFDYESLSLVQHRWIADPGAPVRIAQDVDLTELVIPENFFYVGNLIGVQVPVFLDIDVLCEGHLAVLGMTKMGKTTLAHRLAVALAQRRKTVVLDGTGEYRTKRGVPVFDPADPWDAVGLSVNEPPDKAVRADFALNFVENVMATANTEYASGDPNPRTLVFEEAHDFFPEPATLGFGAPGRDSSYALGLRVMQIRKFGVSCVLVSQRTAVVAKSALSQCENLIVFRSVDRTGLDYLEEISGADVRRLLPGLKQGEAILFGPAVSADGPVAVQVGL